MAKMYKWWVRSSRKSQELSKENFTQIDKNKDQMLNLPTKGSSGSNMTFDLDAGFCSHDQDPDEPLIDVPRDRSKSSTSAGPQFPAKGRLRLGDQLKIEHARNAKVSN